MKENFIPLRRRASPAYSIRTNGVYREFVPNREGNVAKTENVGWAIYHGFTHGYEHVALLGLTFECNLSMKFQHALSAFGTLWHFYVSVVLPLRKLPAPNFYA
ncbi:hypothetical protein [Echinicola rosea]|uniref:hypothetical protein n=1 Tax=Echinicola rosea TaxID=1807691 RepID=UPI0010CA9155|nr:hypothetical protein [Echinicola rosea]